MRRSQQRTVRREALQQVRLQTFLEHPESGAAADVGSERTAHARGDVPLQRKQPAAERGVAAGAVRDRGAAGRQALQFGIGGMNIVRHHRAGAGQLESLIHGQDNRRPTETAAPPPRSPDGSR